MENKITYLIEKFGGNQITTYDFYELPKIKNKEDVLVFSCGFVSYDEHILKILKRSFEKRLLRGDTYLFTDYDKVFINMYLHHFNNIKDDYLKSLSSKNTTKEEVICHYMGMFLTNFCGLEMINKNIIKLNIEESHTETLYGEVTLVICQTNNIYETCVQTIRWLIDKADKYFSNNRKYKAD